MKTVCMMWASAMPKTAIVENIADYFIKAPAPVLVVLPTPEEALDWSLNKLTPKWQSQ
jgi:phage terminase large subunit GpA-like protein